MIFFKSFLYGSFKPLDLFDSSEIFLSTVECISSWVDLLMCRIVKLSTYYLFIFKQLLALSVLYVGEKMKINIT